MYPFERFNKVLKSYVRNRYFPEGCIAEAYLKEESVEFCAEFSRNSFTTAGLPKDQGKLSGPLSAATIKSVEEKERDEAHLHVLLNNSDVFPYINAKDLNPVESDMTFYGRIQDIWELDYHSFKAPLFLCKWADCDRGVKADELGFTLVDLSRQGHKNDKYVSVHQVKQVFYVEDPVDSKWSVILTSTNRDYHEIYNDDDLGDTILENPPILL
ncbi:hypothetical protein DCAR_0727715 [Daucus carota subsp. sativus]|uniref:DUF4216 domain-containing protein n=1 Tax=Daucus carota subsp. sativus TaxID=79200 RepID=A0AAF0XJL9_DAUCS|nr:hypothetical protein DCAR_0727715 [Daucus carota subsp. sativus]